jgi:hypothetical protein
VLSTSSFLQAINRTVPNYIRRSLGKHTCGKHVLRVSRPELPRWWFSSRWRRIPASSATIQWLSATGWTQSLWVSLLSFPEHCLVRLLTPLSAPGGLPPQQYPPQGQSPQPGYGYGASPSPQPYGGYQQVSSTHGCSSVADVRSLPPSKGIPLTPNRTDRHRVMAHLDLQCLQ